MEMTSLLDRSRAPRDQCHATGLRFRGIAGHVARFEVSFDDASRLVLRVKALALTEPAWLLELGEASAHDLRLAADGVPLCVSARGERVQLSCGELELCVDLEEVGLTFLRGGRSLLQTAGNDLNVGGAQRSAPLFRHGDGTGGLGISFGLNHQERVLGGGEDFGSMCKKGQRFWLRNCDALGGNGQERYHSVPYLWSSRGVGLALLSAAPSLVDLATRHDVLQWRATGSGLCLLVQPSASPRAAVAEFRRRSQRVRGVPAWSAEPWLSRCYYRDQGEVEKVLEGARRYGIERGVINLDARSWMRADTRTDFVWDESRFEPFAGFVPRVREQGFQLCLWENPYVSVASRLWQEAAHRGYFARDRAGLPYALRWVPEGLVGFPATPPAGLVDFTNPAACAWWKDLHRPYLRAGVRGFKTDFGEEIPGDAHFADGSDGHVLRNVYADLYNRCVTEVLQEECGSEAIVWARSGWFRAASTPVKWAGDSQTSWRALRGTLRAGLGQAVAGALFWSHDVGGFYGDSPDAELFLRWAQLAMYCSHVRFHGTTAREPWCFGERVAEQVRIALRARQARLPEILDAYDFCVREGLSFVRPLWMDWPNDPACAALDDQFVSGRDVVVAPFLDAEGGRSFYLPEGSWRDLRNGVVLPGGRFHVAPRAEQIPAFAQVAASR